MKQKIIKTFTDLGHRAGFHFEVKFQPFPNAHPVKAEFHLLDKSEFTFSLLNRHTGVSQGFYSVGEEIFVSEGGNDFREPALEPIKCEQLHREIRRFYEIFKAVEKLEEESEQARKKQRLDDVGTDSSSNPSSSASSCEIANVASQTERLP